SHAKCFFFSSRRRHTRLQGDWSSDVCSSDLSLATRPDHRADTHLNPYEVETAWFHPARNAFDGARQRSCAQVPERAYCAWDRHRSEERRVGKECRCWRWTCQ